MKTINVYDIGDKVMIKGTVEAIKVEGGIHKYQIKDIKSCNKIDTWYTGDEIIECQEKQDEETKE